MTNPIARSTQFITEKEVAKIVQEKLEGGSSLSAAVAFWGSGAADSLGVIKQSSSRISIVCNLKMGGTNPEEIIEIKERGVKVGHRDDLHAKVYIFDDSVIVGSSNASANGLAFQEGDHMSWREANIFTSDTKILADAKAWFKEISRKSARVTSADLKVAQDAWSRRRTRNTPMHGRSLYEAARLNPQLLQGRRIYFSLGNEEATEEAKIACENYKSSGAQLVSTEIDFYQNWKTIPEDAFIIDFWDAGKDGISLTGIYQTPPRTISIPVKRGSIQICYKCKKINGLPLGNRRAWERAAIKAGKDGENFLPLSVFAARYLT